jgi:hypothetical protein
MCRKTTIRRLAKRLPQDAVEAILLADAVADEATQNMAQIKDNMADLRALALQAVGSANQLQDPQVAEADQVPAPAAEPEGAAPVSNSVVATTG